MPAAFAASMRLVPWGTSTSVPLIWSLGMGAAPDQLLELVPELLDVADIRADGAIVEGADGRSRAAPGDIQDGVEILLAPLALDDAVGDLVDPPGGFPARRALAARLVGVEARHHHQRVGDGHGLVHHDDTRRADHGTLALGAVHVHRDVDLVRRQDGRGRATGHHGLERAPAADAAAVLVDELPERDRHRRLHDAGLHHVTGDGVEPRAALRLGPERREPLRAPVEDMRQAREGLDVVHDGGLPEGALDGRKRRLDLGPALLAFEGGDQSRLLPADIGSRAPVQDDLEVEARALDVLAEEARAVRLLDGRGDDAPGLDVLAANIDEAQVRADGARGDQHALDQGMGVPLHEVAVLERAGLALVSVDDQVARRRRALGDEAPLDAGRKARAAQAAEVRLLDLLGDGIRLHALGLLPRLVPAGRAIALERVGVRDLEVPRQNLLSHGHSRALMRELPWLPPENGRIE